MRKFPKKFQLDGSIKRKMTANNGTTVTIEGWAYKRDISVNNIKEFLKTKTLPERRA